MTATKICGIKTPEALNAAMDAGARFIGFVFYTNSVRYIAPDQAAQLSRLMPTGVRSVGLFVNPSDRELEQVLGRVPLDMIQLHGDETPERTAEVRVRFEMPVIKALPVRDAADIEVAYAFQDVADWLLFDAKAPSGEYGGTGISFDWRLLDGRRFTKPWMLSGGLTADTVGQALAILKPDAVDVSSGVEAERGVKDAAKIRAFIDAVNAV